MTEPKEFKPVPDDAEDQTAASAKQRLRIHVPYLKTTLSMGEKGDSDHVRGAEDVGDLNFPGFGVTTEGHVFVDANGPPADSTMRLQANGHLTVQTESHLALGGSMGAIVTSSGSTIFSGRDGVLMIDGGGVETWAENQVNDATRPDSPAWIGSLKDRVDVFNSDWSTIDAAVATHGQLKTRTAELLAGLNSKPALAQIRDSHGEHADAMSEMPGFLERLASQVGPTADDLSSPVTSGITVHGTTGLVLSSGKHTGLYSYEGTSIASPGPISLHGVTADLFGSNHVLVESPRDVIVQAGIATVLADKGAIITARTGGTRIGGAQINIGVVSDLSDACQTGTASIAIDATEQASICAGNVSVAGKDLAMVAADTVGVCGATAARLAGGKGLVLLESDQAVIGLVDSAADLSAIATYQDEIASLEDTHKDLMRIVTDARKDVWEGSDAALDALQWASDHADKLATKIDSLKSAIEGLSHGQKTITFKSDGIEICFSDTKIKLDSSSVKSGPIKWDSSA